MVSKTRKSKSKARSYMPRNITLTPLTRHNAKAVRYIPPDETGPTDYVCIGERCVSYWHCKRNNGAKCRVGGKCHYDLESKFYLNKNILD